jgi:hypothetical protein
VSPSDLEDELNRDLMRQLYMQLSEMLQEISSITINLTINNSQTQFVLDSGVTDHMTGNKYLLYNFKKCETNQYVTVGEKIKILGYGSINIFFKEIPNVLFVQNCAICYPSIKLHMSQIILRR